MMQSRALTALGGVSVRFNHRVVIPRFLDLVPVDVFDEAQMFVLDDHNGPGVDAFQRFQSQRAQRSLRKEKFAFRLAFGRTSAQLTLTMKRDANKFSFSCRPPMTSRFLK